MTIEKLLALIVGRTIVAVSGANLEYIHEHDWLASDSSVTFVLDNGVHIDSMGEPIRVVEP